MSSFSKGTATKFACHSLSRLVTHSYRAAQEERDLALAVGRVPRSPSTRLRVQPVLCHVSRVAKCLKPSMRLSHKGGEKVFVDYAGQTSPHR